MKRFHVDFPKHLKITLTQDTVEEKLNELFYQKYTIQLSSGITNKLIKATSLVYPKVVLVRLYGNKTENMIDRQEEIEYLTYLNACGECSPIFYTFENGLMYGYQEGFPLISFSEQEEETLTGSSEMYASVDIPVSIMNLVVSKIASFHQIAIPEKQSMFITKMKDWIKQVPSSFSPTVDLNKELSFLNKILPKSAVNSHNDLLLGNIILEPQQDTFTIHFIDFEYAFPNFRAFDLANFLNELCGFECQWSKFPSKSIVLELIDTYITSSNQTIDKMAFYDELQAGVLASHFLWGLWAIIQSGVSELDFDYATYSQKRLERYSELKSKFIE